MNRFLLCTGLLLLCGCAPIVMEREEIPSPTASGAVASQASSVMKIDIPKAVSGALVLGSDDAPVTMLLFTNYDCAYCKDFQALLERLQTEYIDAGTLRVNIVSVAFQKYPDSDRNAHTLICGVRVGSGSDVNRMLFDGRVNFPALKGCIDDQEYLQSMMAHQHELIRDLEVTLVPTYFLNNTRYTGLPSYADLRGQIEEEKKD